MFGVIPVQVAYPWRLGGPAGVSFSISMAIMWVPLTLLLLDGVIGGLVALKRFNRNNPKWIRSSVITLILVILLLSCTLYYCVSNLIWVEWDWDTLNKVDVMIALVIMSSLIVWFTCWLVALCIYIYKVSQPHKTLIATTDKECLGSSLENNNDIAL